MKSIVCALVFFCMAISGFAQVPDKGNSGTGASDVAGEERAVGNTKTQLSNSADHELAGTVAALNRLRDEIAAEKLPLAKELTATEEQLAQLRREHEEITRQVDTGNLDLIGIKAEIKARQDELDYIGTLLNEYAHSFESKINLSELQYCGDVLSVAKEAAENKALSMTEKFDKQVAFINFSTERMFDVIGGMRFAGTAVNMQGTVDEGTFAIIGPVAFFRSKTGDTSGIVIQQTGSPKPLIRPLEGEMQAGIGSLVERGEGILPLDPSRGGAMKATVQKTSLAHIFEQGGPIMWPLLIVAVLAVITVTERLIFLLNESRKRDRKALERFFTAIGGGDMEAAIQIGNQSKFYLVRALGYALAHKEKSLATALIYAQEQEMRRFRRGIPILDTVITLAPLLGLLGTVTGMMGSFSLIGGDLGAPGAITGGIAEALIATAFGLGIAITSLIPFNYLNTKLEEAQIEIETAATQLELLAHPAEVIAPKGAQGRLIAVNS